VALLANPDLTTKDDQEDEHLSVLEAKVILPLIRTIFRNVAEGMNALQFVNSRTEVEKIASQRMKEELQKYRLSTDGVFIGNIDLDENDAGRQLLATQTDRELALNQQQTFAEKKRAEESRATFIKAQAEAEQQKVLAEATYQVQVKEQQAKAREAEAKGEASYIQITSEAKKNAYTAIAGAIGPQGVVQLELLRAVAEGKVQITPQVMVTGGGVNDALAGTILRQTIEEPRAKGK
jgi:regulator of protease activity HflC (stomatin/prohibitin superfamily)